MELIKPTVEAAATKEVVAKTVKKAPVSTKEKAAEKLKILREKREKALAVQSAAEKKTKDISAQMAKYEKELHNEEVKELDILCKKAGITYDDVIKFVSALYEKSNFKDAAEIMDLSSRKDNYNV